MSRVPSRRRRVAACLCGLAVGATMLQAMPSGARPADGHRGSRAATRAARGPHEYGCPLFPADNSLNRDISHAPMDPNSARYIASIGLGGHLHPDFGTPAG